MQQKIIIIKYQKCGTARKQSLLKHTFFTDCSKPEMIYLEAKRKKNLNKNFFSRKQKGNINKTATKLFILLKKSKKKFIKIFGNLCIHTIHRKKGVC